MRKFLWSSLFAACMTSATFAEEPAVDVAGDIAAEVTATVGEEIVCELGVEPIADIAVEGSDMVFLGGPAICGVAIDGFGDEVKRDVSGDVVDIGGDVQLEARDLILMNTPGNMDEQVQRNLTPDVSIMSFTGAGPVGVNVRAAATRLSTLERANAELRSPLRTSIGATVAREAVKPERTGLSRLFGNSRVSAHGRVQTAAASGLTDGQRVYARQMAQIDAMRDTAIQTGDAVMLRQANDLAVRAKAALKADASVRSAK